MFVSAADEISRIRGFEWTSKLIHLSAYEIEVAQGY